MPRSHHAQCKCRAQSLGKVIRAMRRSIVDMVGLPKGAEGGAALAGDCGDILTSVPQVPHPAGLRRLRPMHASRAPERFVGFMLGIVVREADISQRTAVELRK